MRKNLKDHKYSQCHVRLRADEIQFWSYSTLVITATYRKDGGHVIRCTGTYSPTTRRQIGWFLKEYFPALNYYDIKEIAGQDPHAMIILNRGGEVIG